MFARLTHLIRRIIPSGIVGDTVPSKQRSLLRLLAVAHSQRLDPRILVHNLAAEHKDAYGRKLNRLESWIAAGSPVSTALAQTPGTLDESDALAVQCGAETNLLSETFSYLLENEPPDDDKAGNVILRNTFGYAIATCFFAFIVTAFLMIYIVPTFEQIFEDFGIELPVAMSTLVEFSNGMVVAIAPLLLILIGVSILFLLNDFRHFLRYSPLGRWFPTVAAKQTAGLLRLLAVPTANNLPVAPTMTAAAQFHPDRRYRQKLLQARTDSRNETDIWLELSRQGLISNNQAQQLGRIRDPALRAWTLTTLADRINDRSSQHAQFLARILQYAPVVLPGILVAWVAIAVMQTLTGLIQSLA